MPEVPNDLVTIPELAKRFRPSRWWWDQRIQEGAITAYIVPGSKAKYVSLAAAEKLVQIQAYDPNKDKGSGQSAS